MLVTDTRGTMNAGSNSEAAGEAAPSEAERIKRIWRNAERRPPGVSLCETPLVKQVMLLSGWACEMRILPDGRRQIFGFCLPGDRVDLAAHSDLDNRGVLTLTAVELVAADNLGVGGQRGEPTDVEGTRQQSLREERMLDHLMRIGKLTASERVLHLLLELHERLDAVGLVKNNAYRLPLTCEVIADALGLSVVHISRTLKQLRREGTIELKSGFVTLHNLARLDALACYRRTRPAPAAEATAPTPRRAAELRHF